jgi:hypothetical protein
MGRKTILNEQLIERIVEQTLNGISIESLCALSGISTRVYYQWRDRGDDDFKEGLESVYTLFAESIRAADVEVEQRLLDHDLLLRNNFRKTNRIRAKGDRQNAKESVVN